MKRLLLSLSVVLSLSLNAADRLDCTDEIAKTPAKAFEYVVTCDRPDGIYRCGETATVNVRVRNATTGMPVSAGKVRVELDALDNRVFRTEEHDLAKEGCAFTVTGTLAKPGFLRLRLHKGDEAKFKPWCVAFDPDGIPPGVDDPPDFDAFWADAYAKYERNVPFDFEKRFDADQSSPWNDVYRFSFVAPDGKTRLYGFISYPKDRSRKYPARFEVPSAGVGGWTLGPSAYQRDRTVNVLLNIFPFEMPKTVAEARVPYDAWCKALKEKYGAGHYMSAGMGASREEATLYNYFLGAKRCIEWLRTQPEVDASRLYYWGASQGGGYGTCVVGLSGRFTKAVVCVPCLVHDLGRFGREPSGGGSDVQAMHAEAKARTVAAANWPYFSAENFARRIRCETMVTVGFCDPTCAPHGGWSIYNLIPAAKKHIVGAVNQPHGPPDPVWYGTQEWLLGFSGWRETFGPQAAYIHDGGTAAVKGDLTEKIRAKCEVVKTDEWHGGRRTVFKFHGREAWVVEPPEGVSVAEGCPWTWTIQWWTAFVNRTGVPQLLKRGWRHAVLDMFDTRASDAAMPEFAAFQEFLVKELGFAPQVNLIGMSWGGFFSTRYAAHYPANVAKIFLDCPLLNLGGRCGRAAGEDEIGIWARLKPENWIDDPRMPINLAKPLADAKIPILLRYGGADDVLEPALNSEIFIPRFKAAGGQIRVIYQIAYGHHPHGFDESDTTIADFFTGKGK